MKIHKVLATSAIACAVSSFGLAGPAFATESPTSENGLTKAEYISQLESQGDAKSQQALGEFESMDPKAQSDVLAKVTDPGFYEAAFSSNAEAQKNYGIDVKSSEGTRPATRSYAAAASSGSQTHTFTKEARSLGIRTLTIEQTYKFTTDGNKVTSSDSCTATFDKPFPLASVEEKTDHSVTGDTGTCTTNWTASITTPLGQTNFSSVQEQVAHGDGSVDESFRDL